MPSALDKLYGAADQRLAEREQRQQQQDTTDDIVSSLLPPTVRKAREARLRKEAGEDPRVTEYYQRTNNAAAALLPADVRKKRNERMAAEFYAANPDLNPAVATQELETKPGVKENAEKVLQTQLRLYVDALEQVQDQGEGPDRKPSLQEAQRLKEANDQYNKIKGQLTPELRAKYNLDAFEQAGLGWEDSRSFGDRFKEQTLGSLASDPLMGPILHELGKPQQLVTGALAEAWRGDIGAASQNLTNIANPLTYLSDDNLQKAVEPNDLNGDGVLDLRDALNAPVDPATGNRNIGPGTYGEWSGVPTDALNRTAELGWAVFSDPATYVGRAGVTARAQAGFAALEKEGLVDLARQIRRDGFQSLDEVQLSAVTEAVNKQYASGVLAGARDLGQNEAVLKELAERGRSGIRVGSYTIPTPRIPGRGGARRPSALESVSNTQLPTHIAAGDKIPGFGMGTVEEVLPDGWRVTPSESIEVVRDNVPTVVTRDEILPGDSMADGLYVVRSVEDGGLIDIQATKPLAQIERPFRVVPRHETGTQGSLLQQVEEAAPTERPQLVPEDRTIYPREPGQPGRGETLLHSDVPGRYPEIPQGEQGAIFDETKLELTPEEAVRAAPRSSDSGGFGDLVDQQLAGTDMRDIGDGVFVRSIDDGAGGKIIGLYDETENLLGYMMATDDAVAMFQSLVKTKGMGQRILDAARDEGLDVPKLLANSDFTDDGRKAALRWLKNNKPKAEVVAPPAPAAAAPGAPRSSLEDVKATPRMEGTNRMFTANVELSKGSVSTARPWYQRASGKRPLKEGMHVLSGDGHRLFAVNGYTDNGLLIATPTRTSPYLDAPVGTEIPELAGKVVDNADGVLTIAPISGEGIVRADAPVRPTAVAEEVTEPAVRAGEIPVRSLTEEEAYPTPATTQIEKAKVQPGTIDALEPDPQGRLFDRAVVDVDDIEAEDWIPTLNARVRKKVGRRMFQAQLDDVPVTVLRDGVVERVSPRGINVGDVLPDTGVRVIARHKDGSLTLRPELGTQKSELRLVPGGVEAGAAPIGARIASPKANRSTVGRATERVGEAVSSTARAFTPRFNIRQAEALDPGRVVPGTAREVGAQVSGAAARTANAQAVLRESLQGAWDLVRKDLGKDAQATLARALDVVDPEDTRAVIAELELAGKTDAAEGIRRFGEIRARLESIVPTDTAAEILKRTEGKLPYILTPEGAKLLDADELLRRQLLRDKRIDHLSRGFDFSRDLDGTKLTIEANPETGRAAIELNLDTATHAEVNKALSDALSSDARAVLGLPVGETLEVFSTDPLTVYSMRGRSQFQRAMDIDLVENLSKPFGGEAGIVRQAGPSDPAYIRARGRKAAGEKGNFDDILAEEMAADGLEAVPGMEGVNGQAFAAPEVAKELGNLKRITTEEESIKKFQKAMQRLNNTWARMRTSPITKGLGFQTRNGISNSTMSILGGIADGFVDYLPEGANRAVKAIRGTSKAMDLVKKKGLTFEQALIEAVPDEQMRAFIQTLQDRGVVRQGFFRRLSYDDQALETARVTSRKQRIKGRLNPFDQDFIITKPGQKVNEIVEDFNRITHFSAVLDATGSIDEALRSTNKYLFDYNDLTPFERKYAKNINRFYTFMRKNTALQIAMFMEHPGLMANYQRQISKLYGGGDEGNELERPGEGGTAQRGPAAGVFNSLLNSGRPGVVGLDSPLDSAVKTLNLPVQLAYYSIPGLKDTLPPSEQPTLKTIFGSVKDLGVGAPIDALDTIYKYRTGVDPSYEGGAKLSGKETLRGELVDFFLPVWDQGARNQKGITEKTNIFRLITGIAYADRSSEEERATTLWLLNKELEEEIARLRAQGEEVPTIGDLRDAGLIPTEGELRGETPSARKVPLPAEMRQQAARDTIGR